MVVPIWERWVVVVRRAVDMAGRMLYIKNSMLKDFSISFWVLIV